MTPAQFTRALAATRMPADSATARAARLALVDGMSAQAAAKAVGIDRRAVDRAVERLQPMRVCPRCKGSGHLPAS